MLSAVSISALSLTRCSSLSRSPRQSAKLSSGASISTRRGCARLEDGQIIRRSLDRDLPFGRRLCSPAIFRPVLIAQDRLDGLQVQWGAAAVAQGLKHLVHVPTDVEDQ